MHRNTYLPEGCGALLPEKLSLSALQECVKEETVWEGVVIRCDSSRNLHVQAGGYSGVIPREEVVHPYITGSERDIAILSRVGRRVCFTVTGVEVDAGGRPHLTLSRRNAQEQAIHWLLEHASVGDILPACVTHLAAFGAFVDLGCGFISLIPLENISYARVSHPKQRFQVGQEILVLVTDIQQDSCRFYLSHKELLGTWLENAADFAAGETVTGIVRGIREYGTFVELSPNLSGLAEGWGHLPDGELVSVYIKSIRPEVQKVKLQIVDDLGVADRLPALRYRITDGTIKQWCY